MKRFVFPVLLFSFSALAAIAPQSKNALRNSAILQGSGSIRGGMAGAGFSLLDIQSKVAKSKKLERLTVALGDSNFRPYKGSPGYFHVENAADQKRVVINFMQAINAKFDEKTLQKNFASSPFVQSSRMLFDPETQTLSLVLQMKRQAGVRVVALNGNSKQAAQLKIDLFEEALLKGKPKKK